MKTPQKQINYKEWFSVEEMYMKSKEWLSELEFAKDEHLFFEDIIKSYTLQLIATKKFSENKEIIDAINHSEKRNNLLVEAIMVHKNELHILVDRVGQPREEASLKNGHRNLIILVSEFLKDYRNLKLELFDIIQTIKKVEKRNLLLGK